jgi:hypothetical protein
MNCLREEEADEERQDAEGGGGHEQVPLGASEELEHREADLIVASDLSCVTMRGQRKVFQLLTKGEDRDRRHRRRGERQEHLAEEHEARAAVDARGVPEVARQGEEELAQHEDAEEARDPGHDEREVGVEPAELHQDDVVGHEQDLGRDHHRGHHQAEEDVLARELEVREGEGGERAGDQLAERAAGGDEERS